ncbi:MAG TPA: MBL fold metallo-hydrolase [Humisphaera sp.]
MIEPVQQDDALLDDVLRATRESPQAVHLWWLGQSGYLVRWGERSALLDPYLSDSLTAKYAATEKPHVRISHRVIDPGLLDFVDVVTSSHNHTDHLDSETLGPILVDSEHDLLCPEANIAFVCDRLKALPSWLTGIDDGVTVGLGGFRFTGVAAAHDTIERDSAGRCRYLGYVVRTDAFTIYHSGDTVVYDGMAEKVRALGPIDVAILPINGKVGNMGGRDAAHLAKAIGARVVIPCHYDMFEFNTADPYAEFVPECERIGQPYRVLKLGERFSSGEIP